ncbi:low affinity iron permease family protein [Sphingobium sp. DEHP117]|uniref:low affinity iron permease family protein n=1 Tax=Sphingobium sp. DEHP117 TaxID=2993436 RepID=UPI0027D71AAB|nr:low affinity iron permease family protein [Sphingobium sp. DEHP117]MDQ4419144.1 low affinity iron permease family protein [Sphingobium sp. DEHP117]
MDRFFTRISTSVSAAVGQPWAFVIALAFIIAWGASGPIFQYSDTWQLVVNTSTTIVTFLMVFVIQNSQNRDSAAIQAKLDELIRAVEEARTQFIGIEHKSQKELEEIRSGLEQECDADEKGSPKRSLESLIERN